MEILHFWNWWRIAHQDNAHLTQGRPEWRPEATYEDPTFDYLGFWPRVYRDEHAGGWRMLYFGSGFPLKLLGAESADGIHWRPMECPDVLPGGEKYAPNHLLTVPSANGAYEATGQEGGLTFVPEALGCEVTSVAVGNVVPLSGRPGVHVRLASADGTTWSEPVFLFGGAGCANSAMQLDLDGTLVIAYTESDFCGQEYPGDTNHIKMVRLRITD